MTSKSGLKMILLYLFKLIISGPIASRKKHSFIIQKWDSMAQMPFLIKNIVLVKGRFIKSDLLNWYKLTNWKFNDKNNQKAMKLIISLVGQEIPKYAAKIHVLHLSSCERSYDPILAFAPPFLSHFLPKGPATNCSAYVHYSPVCPG